MIGIRWQNSLFLARSRNEFIFSLISRRIRERVIHILLWPEKTCNNNLREMQLICAEKERESDRGKREGETLIAAKAWRNALRKGNCIYHIYTYILW